MTMKPLLRQKTTYFRLADTPATAKAWVVEDIEAELDKDEEWQEKVVSSPEPAATTSGASPDKNSNTIEQMRKKMKMEKQQEVGFLIIYFLILLFLLRNV